MKKLNRRQLRNFLLKEISSINEALPGEVNNLSGALQKLYELYEKNLGLPPQYGGFPETLLSLIEALKFSEQQRNDVIKAYRTR